MSISLFLVAIACLFIASSEAFTAAPTRTRSTALFMAEDGEVKAAPQVSGEQLELMLQEWDTPLVIDAYATWCGPCLLMSPEFEAAAKELEGKVRFVKLDTDRDEQMAARLAINGLPTLLFLDKYTPPEGSDEEVTEEQKDAQAVLKDRIEGALRKESIVELCEFHFFDGPEPGKLFG